MYIFFCFSFYYKCQIQQWIRSGRRYISSFSFFFLFFLLLFLSPVSTSTVATFPLLRKSNAFDAGTETDVGVNSRALSLLLWFSFQDSMGLRALREGGIGKGTRRKERASVRESVCDRERKKEREKRERRGEHSDATRSHAPGSDLPIALSGFRKSLQSWVEHALVFKLPMANHTSFFFCKREPSSKTARFQRCKRERREQP